MRDPPLPRAATHRLSGAGRPKAVLAGPSPRKEQGEEDTGELLLCVSDLGSPGEDGGCEVASPNGPCHSWHACHRYIGPKFKCLQKVKM